MNEIEKQKLNIATLLELTTKNPDLEIVPMVDTDIVGSDEFSWWTANWGNASIEEIYNNDERVYIRSKDEQKLVDNAFNFFELNPTLTDEEAEKKAIEEVKNYDWEKVIAVRITV